MKQGIVRLERRGNREINLARYEVYDGSTHLGWVTCWQDPHAKVWTWSAYVASTVNRHTSGTASQIAQNYARHFSGCETRREAVAEILIWLRVHAYYVTPLAGPHGIDD